MLLLFLNLGIVVWADKNVYYALFPQFKITLIVVLISIVILIATHLLYGLFILKRIQVFHNTLRRDK